jgi:hypothetical protein
MLGSVDRALDHRRLTTPVVLRAGMVLLCLPVLVLAGTVHVAVTVNDEAVDTVGVNATDGIATAQRIKANLAGLDEIAVRTLLADGGDRDDLRGQYAEQRRDLHDSLAAAAADAPPGDAHEMPLVNIDYALGHYHALVDDSVEAIEQGDAAAATTLYGQAHEVMAGTLLPEADFIDKANTYLLNDTYDEHRDDAESRTAGLVVAGSVVVGLLVMVQIVLARRFRRIVNPMLLAATGVAIALCALISNRLDRSADQLAAAREEAFDSVHLLARSEAAVMTVRQAQGHRLFDPGNEAIAETFGAESRKLFRVPEGQDVAAVASTAENTIPEGAGGYLAAVINGEMGAFRYQGAAWDSLRSFGAFLDDDAALRNLAGDRAVASFEKGDASTALLTALDQAEAEQQARFDEHADAAEEATSGLPVLNRVAFLLLVGLVVGGLYVRLREYRG